MQRSSGKRDKQLRRHFQRTSLLHEGLLDEQARLNDSLQQLCDTLSRLKEELGKHKEDKAQFGGIRADLDLVQKDRKRIYLSEVELERIRKLEDGLDKENQALVDEINEQRTNHQSTRTLFLQTRADLQAAQAELQRELTNSEQQTAATLRLEDQRDAFEASELKALKDDQATLEKLEARLKRARRLQRLARVGTKQQREKAGKTMQAEHAEQAKEYKEQLQRIHQLQDDIKDLEAEKNTCAETSESLRQQREQLSDILDRMAVRAKVRSHDELIRMFQASEDDRLEQARCIQRCGDEQKNVEQEIREALHRYDAAVEEKHRRTRAAQQAAAAGQTELMHNDVMCRLAQKEIRTSKLQLGQATEMLHRLLLRTRPDRQQMAVFKQISKALAPPRKDRTGYTQKKRPRGSSHAVGHRPFFSGELRDSQIDRARSNSMNQDEAASTVSDAPRAMSPVSIADAGLDGDLGEDQSAEDGASEPSTGQGQGSDSVSASYAQQLVSMAEASATRAIERAAVLLLQPHVRSQTVSVLRYALPEGPPDPTVDETIVSDALQMYRRGPAAGLDQADVGRDSRKSIPAKLEEHQLGQGSLASAAGGEEGHEWMDESELPVEQSTNLQEGMASVMSGSLPNLPSLPDLSENPAALAQTLSMVQQLESTGQLPPPDTQPLATGGLGGSESSSRAGSQASLPGISGLLASRKQVGPVSRDALDRWMEQASVALRQPPVPATEGKGAEIGALRGLGAPATPMGRAGHRVMRGDGGFRSSAPGGGNGLGRSGGGGVSSLRRHPADKISGTAQVPTKDRNGTVPPAHAEATMAQLTPMRA